MTCPRCYGNGYVYWPREGGGMQPETCLKCNGSGEVKDRETRRV